MLAEIKADSDSWFMFAKLRSQRRNQQHLLTAESAKDAEENKNISCVLNEKAFRAFRIIASYTEAEVWQYKGKPRKLRPSRRARDVAIKDTTKIDGTDVKIHPPNSMAAKGDQSSLRDFTGFPCAYPAFR